MNDPRVKLKLGSTVLVVASALPAVARAQGTAASSPESGASQPPPDKATIIDPTFFVAIGAALVIGFLIGRATAGGRRMAH